MAPNVISDLFVNLKKILDLGTTLLIVEQRAHLVTSFADEVLVIREGAIQARLNREDSQDEAKLRHSYFGTGAHE